MTQFAFHFPIFFSTNIIMIIIRALFVITRRLSKFLTATECESSHHPPYTTRVPPNVLPNGGARMFRNLRHTKSTRLNTSRYFSSDFPSVRALELCQYIYNVYLVQLYVCGVTVWWLKMSVVYF